MKAIAKINKIKGNCKIQLQRSIKLKTGSLKDNIDKPLARLIKRKREKT